MKKLFSFVALTCSFLILCSLCARAHPGRTDANGGHWDRSSGTYHFHTGEYAGQGSSGSSSNTENVPFTPPYEPPTENPYTKSKQNLEQNSSNKTDIGDIIGYLIIASPFLFFLLCLLCAFIETLLPNYRINALNEKTNKLISCNKKRAAIEENILKKENGSLIPEEYEIGSDGLPKERGCNHWGETFTVYKTYSGHKLHAKRYCCSAAIPQHIYSYARYHDLNSLLCSKCSNRYKVPDLKWYTILLKYEEQKKELERLNADCLQLQQEASQCHKKCNSSFIRFLLFFSKKNQTKLQETNEKYAQIQITEREHSL